MKIFGFSEKNIPSKTHRKKNNCLIENQIVF